jgi:hypothetical protein
MRPEYCASRPRQVSRSCWAWRSPSDLSEGARAGRPRSRVWCRSSQVSAIEEHGVYPTVPARAFYPPLRLLDPIPREEPVGIAGLKWTLIPNMSCLRPEGVGYEAMLLAPLSNTYPLWWSHAFSTTDRESGSAFVLSQRRLHRDRPAPRDLPGWPRSRRSGGPRSTRIPGRCLARCASRRLTDQRADAPDHAEHRRLRQRRRGRAAPWASHAGGQRPADVRIDSYADHLSLDRREGTR